MKKTLAFMAIAILVALLSVPAALLAAGSSDVPSSSMPSASPAQQAADAYNRGLRYRDKAWEYEKKAVDAASDKERDKLTQKAQKEFGKAIRAFETALKYNPQMHQAHSSLGYALRRTGDYQASIESYDRALEIEPRYAEAIEYRAEAYLGLNRLEEAKEAYLVLFRSDRDRADELMAAMEKWVEARRADPAEIDGATLEEFAGWVAERSEVSRQTASLGAASTDSW